MKRLLSSLLVSALCLSCYQSIGGQTQTKQHQDEQVLRLGTTEVSLDIVVRDKKGRLIKDLKPSDFEVYEDGVVQKIESFRFIQHEARTSPTGESTDPKQPTPVEASSPKTTALKDNPTPGVVALIFDRLSPDARSLARKAGAAYAEEGNAAGDFTGVFGIDQSLRTLQSYTDKPELIRQAIERATSAATSTYVSGSGKVRDLSDRSTALDQEATSSAAGAVESGAARDSAGASAAGAASGQAAAQQAFIEMETRILENFELLERDQQGFATINSLLAVISGMRNLPGRKSIVIFSEGLALPSSVSTKFNAVINAANRAGVTIYAIESGGLRVQSGTEEATREINSIASRRMQQSARAGDTMTSEPYTKALERNEDLLRLDPRSGLGTLADETGGFLIHDTNDLRAGLRRIDDDMRAYYLLSYVPKNAEYDGRFRQISVKLARSNLEVQTRKGYYAIESVGQLPVLDYEAPALAALKRTKADTGVTFHAAALSFPATGKPGLTLVLAEAPLSAFTIAPAKDKKTYSADFSVVALIRNQSNEVVQKLSQHYPLSGPVEKLEAAKKGDVLFYREVQLPPGRYTVDFVAYDGPAARAGVRAAQLEIASFDDTKPRLSSVVVLKRAERISAAEQQKDQPFHFGELLVYPNMGEPLLKSTAKQLTFFVTAWPTKGSAETPNVTMEILQNNKVLGQTTAQLPSADEHGSIKYASALPLDSFQPGVYELKITVKDKKGSVSRSTPFTLKP
jgi:VWFA-related protein